MEYLLSRMINFDKENLENSLYRRKILTYVTGCREVANREIHARNYNFFTAVDNFNFSFKSLEILADLDNVTRILQYLTRTDSIFCGNRFFYRTNTSKYFYSPMGSIITGILKLIVSHKIESSDYETFVKELIELCFTHTKTLGSEEVSTSVGVAIKLFLDRVDLPSDPRGNYTYGTFDYLTSSRWRIINILGESKTDEYKNYFTKLGAKPEILSRLI